MNDIPNGNNLSYRITQIEKEIDRLNREKARAEDLLRIATAVEQRARAEDVSALKVSMATKAEIRDLDRLSHQVDENSDKVTNNTRSLIGFAFAVAMAAIGVAIAVLQGGP